MVITRGGFCPSTGYCQGYILNPTGDIMLDTQVFGSIDRKTTADMAGVSSA